MPEPLKQIINGHEFWMIPVEGGVFNMGSPENEPEADDYEKPLHKVTVSDFYIGMYPVTQTLWKAVMNGENPSQFQGDDLPVEQVSWEDITQQFLPALRRLTGKDYRLPTEAEWEYSARGGKYHTEGYKYAGSDRLKDVGWFMDNSGGITRPVGLKRANQLGIYDMSGNIWEWCEDWFGGWEYYQICKQIGIVQNPHGPESGSVRVNRGGSWDYTGQFCRICSRINDMPFR